MSEKIKRKLLHFFFPTRCPVCGDVIGSMDSFCGECTQKLSICTNSENIVGAESFTAAFEYDENISPAIMLMKNGVCGNADYALGNALAVRLEELKIHDRIDVIIPVPMYRADKAKRGFNQAELIADVIGRRFNIPISVKSVIKTKKTIQQKSLDRKMRMQNLKGAYDVVKPGDIAGKRILLVDDVSTTGSTLTELTSLLLKNGAAEIHCAACCKTPEHHKHKKVT